MGKDRTIHEVAAELRLGERTLERYLASDLTRAADDRRFQFHCRRGRKRIWTPEGYQKLRDAIERASTQVARRRLYVTPPPQAVWPRVFPQL